MVIYDSYGKALWEPPSWAWPDYLIQQGDDNFVEYNQAHTALWSSGTGGHGYSNPYVIMQSDGNLVLYGASGNQYPLWNAGTSWDSHGSALLYGDVLTEGHTLTSVSNNYQLRMQTDGNLVLYNSGNGVLWNAGKSNSSGCPTGHVCTNYLAMQTDGNLVLYSYDESNGGYLTALWSSGSGGTGGQNHLLVGNGGTFTVDTVTGAVEYTS